ncbi:MAG: hypothetical protein ACPG6M_03830 [Paracoccaceae bacterium]
MSALAKVVVASTLVAACSGTTRNVNAVKFDGHYFAGRASKSSADPHGFSVRIRNAAKSIAGARDAARYEATIYCIEQFGTSDIIWSIGPDDEAISLSNRSMTLAGRCDPK